MRSVSTENHPRTGQSAEELRMKIKLLTGEVIRDQILIVPKPGMAVDLFKWLKQENVGRICVLDRDTQHCQITELTLEEIRQILSIWLLKFRLS
jgi:hypothetical protein